MMAEEGRIRKQHLLSALSHVSRWESNRGEAQQISSEIPSFRTFTFFTERGLFLILFSPRWKTTPSLIMFTDFPTIGFHHRQPSVSAAFSFFLIHFHLNHSPVQKYKTETQESTHGQIPSIHVLTSTSDSLSIPIPQHSHS